MYVVHSLSHFCGHTYGVDNSVFEYRTLKRKTALVYQETRFSDYHAPQLQNTSFFDPVMYGIVTLQFCPVLLTETIGRINRNHAHRTVRVRFNPFAPEPPRTARADPRPFYPL